MRAIATTIAEVTSINPFNINEEIAKHDDHMTREDEQARELGAFLARLDVAADPHHAQLPASLLRRTAQPGEPADEDRATDDVDGR